MKLSRIAAFAAVAGLAHVASAQVFLNEIYASHTGTDNQEFIELVGPAGQSLDGYAVMVVEGEGASAGTLDRLWDLTGTSIQSSGYFVLGNTGLMPDFDIGNDNGIENGTETIYVVSGADIAGLSALVGTNIDADGDLTTDIPGLSTIEDLVGMVNADYPMDDNIYDGAEAVGPDGTFFPAGIYRGGDYPAGWCDSYLDFGLANDRTPGAMNIDCPSDEPGTAYCFGNGCACADDAAAGCGNSTGSGALLSASGSNSAGNDDLVLTLTSLPAFQNGIVFGGPNQIDLPFGDGKRCVGGTVVRFPIRQADASGVITEGPGIAATAGYMAGMTVNFQGWYRDPAGTCTGSAFNLSNAYSVTYGM